MTIQDFAPIQTARLTLRRFRDEDLAAFLAYRNDPAVARFQGWTIPMSEADGRAFIDEQRVAPVSSAGGGIQIAVALTATDELLGDLYLGVADHDLRQGLLGYTFAREHHGRGYATEAASAMLRYTFVELGLHRVIATLDARNTRSAALLERLGLRREGHFVQAYYDERHGEWTDEYQYAILRAEWVLR
jgi:RimJ/RimL family protein N-acetyltransferase